MLEIGGSGARVYFLLFRLSFRLESWERADGMTFVIPMREKRVAGAAGES